MLTMSSRDFNQDTGRAKKAAIEGPVVITDRGRPAHVLLSYEAYKRLTTNETKGKNIIDLMYMPGVADIELVIPPRKGSPAREADFT